MVAKAALHPMHRRFRQAAAMVARAFLPTPAATAADFPNRHVPGQRAAPRIAVLRNLRVALRRDDGLRSTLFQDFVDLPLVVRPVAVEGIRRAGHLIQQRAHLARVVATVFRQGFRFDLLRRRVDRQVQLPPGTAFALAVLTHLPLPLAKNLQAGAIGNHVDRPGVPADVQRNLQLRSSLGQRRVIGNVEGGLHQFHQRSQALRSGDREAGTALATPANTGRPCRCRRTGGPPSVGCWDDAIGRSHPR